MKIWTRASPLYTPNVDDSPRRRSAAFNDSLPDSTLCFLPRDLAFLFDRPSGKVAPAGAILELHCTTFIGGLVYMSSETSKFRALWLAAFPVRNTCAQKWTSDFEKERGWRWLVTWKRPRQRNKVNVSHRLRYSLVMLIVFSTFEVTL